MSAIIVVRHLANKNELYRHELSQGEKPWEILQQLMQMEFGPSHSEIEFVMDPEREQRETQQKQMAEEAAANFGQP